MLELHYRVVGQYQYNRANQLVDSIYSPTNLKKSTQPIHGYAYTVFPPTEYVFYMIHHMLKHYLYSGFGIRLLCDFTFYLKCHENEIDFHESTNGAENHGSATFTEIILECCRKYLGLPDSIDANTHYSPDALPGFHNTDSERWRYGNRHFPITHRKQFIPENQLLHLFQRRTRPDEGTLPQSQTLPAPVARPLDHYFPLFYPQHLHGPEYHSPSDPS